MTRDEEERQMISKVDGELFKWTVSAILGLTSTFGTMWLTKIQDQLDQVTHDFYVSGKQISVLETNVETLHKRLDRIEQKLDVLIDTKSLGRRQ